MAPERSLSWSQADIRLHNAQGCAARMWQNRQAEWYYCTAVKGALGFRPELRPLSSAFPKERCHEDEAVTGWSVQWLL